ncbi:MAG: thioredoxin family protein [candidate division KSB1 bacterium]|nr:thioredoxin family protein [candidate division KSB1 bacterium]MDZ7413439.1 thioredoxin family protein [candidate division KSB1 bacterium]
MRWPTLAMAAAVVAVVAACHTQRQPKVLTGWLTQERLLMEMDNYRADFDKYEPDEEALAVLRSYQRDVDLLAFIGTWCPDCAREVPRFLKSVYLAHNPRLHVKLLALDRSLRDPEGVAERFSVTHVPTFVVVIDGMEIGRIVETPSLTVEQDLALLLAAGADL